MSRRTRTQNRTWKERALSLLLTAALLIGAVPALTLPASAHWADEYLDQLVDWGVLRADQTGDPDAPITRADFAAIINRAYGYSEVGPIPFTDVSVDDWFYDDIAIGYNAGYMAGTSSTTASPNDTLTREMAVCILGRNMMMKETSGETLAFTDGRDISSWARGLVKTAVDSYVISGYPDNSFGPQDPITKAQMAVLVTQCVGQPVSQSGAYSLGGVFGNVTITSPNVTLRDTTISGDLYVSGGVGLGGILLENVNVLGRIVVSSSGESEGGDASVIMRNVTANEMLVDNMRNKTVTVRADGITDIAETTVRTPAYLEDNNTDDKGLMHITLDGEPGSRLTLAGRIKEVTNKTPSSTVQVAKGTVAKLTVDEAATTSTVQIDRNTEVKELNLDVGTSVVGEGDIEKLNVNAPGSVVTMLPDQIYIRPGLTANIAGVIMDYTAALEGSTDPRLLSGYPAANDIAPTGFRADFAGNKQGTIYWAVSNITDGSIAEDDLISPPSYGSKAIRNGSITAPAGGDEVSAQVTGLTVAGSYYLSAILVDDQNRRSPVKVVSFTTPDNTVPAFAQGYPYMSLITDTMAQVTVMPTKTCRMYYAVLPRSATAPTAAEMKAAAVTNNLGYGVVDVEKNKEFVQTVSLRLEELKDYTLYLWLTDVDGVNSSAVIPVQFTTKDMTPPEFTVPPYVNQIQATAVRLAATLNEDGTVYWAVVERGTAYPKPQPGVPNYDEDGVTVLPYAALDSDYAKLQVSSGMNCLKSGSVSVKQNTEFTINVTGLAAEKTYDLYYLAKDAAGNFSVQVEKLEIHTQDNSGPVVQQYFSEYTGLDNTQNPLPSTDIVLEFSEDVASTNDGWGGLSFLSLATGSRPAAATLWPDDPKEVLANALFNSIELYQIVNGREQRVNERNRENENDTDLTWTIDYRNATVTAGEGGKILVTFPTKDETVAGAAGTSALNLASGATYFFRFRDLIDTAPEQNKINPHPLDYSVVGAELHHVPAFTTVFAQVNLTSPGVGRDGPYQRGDDGKPTDDLEYVDLSFRMDPDATEKVEDNNSYDILLYADTATRYNLYYRILDATTGRVVENPDSEYLLPAQNTTADSNGWYFLGNSSDVNPAPDWSGRSVNGQYFNNCDDNGFPRVNQLNENYTYEFVIALTQYGTSTDRPTWNGQINFEIHVVAGLSHSLNGLATNPSKNELEDFLENGLENNGGVSIGINRTQNYLPLRGSFIDSKLPEFSSGYPQFEPGDSFANVKLNLTRSGTIYYVIAKSDQLRPALTESPGLSPEEVWAEIEYPTPTKPATGDMPEISSPIKGNIFNPAPYRSSAVCGSVPYPGGEFTLDYVLGTGDRTLEPETDYYAYFVLKGVSDELSQVYVYKFTTTETARPKIDLRDGGLGTVLISTTNTNPTISADIDYAFFTSSDLSGNPIFDQKLSANRIADDDLPDGVPPYGTYYADHNKDDNGTGQDYTILEALMATYIGTDSNNGSSVFDVYANTNTKNQVADIIRQSSAGNPIRSSIVVEAGTQPRLDHTKDMKMGDYYYVLAVGHHVSGVTDGFKAVYNIVVPDSEPPRVQSISTSLENNPEGSNKYTGYVTIVFDKPVYWIQANMPAANRVPVAYTKGDNAYCITDVLGGGLSPKVEKSGTAAGQEFTLWFDTSKPATLYGSMVMFTGDGRIANASGQSDGQPLTFTLMDGPVQTGKLTISRPYFTVTYTDSNGKQVTVEG